MLAIQQGSKHDTRQWGTGMILLEPVVDFRQLFAFPGTQLPLPEMRNTGEEHERDR